MGAAPVEEEAGSPGPPVYLTRFVGRRTELAKLVNGIRHAAGAPAHERLIVLTGMGGSGKTRLAVEATARLVRDQATAGEPADVTWWVDLSGLPASSSLASAIAEAAGVPAPTPADPMPGLVRALRRRRAVLVMDNCEDLAEACEEVWSALLPACPGLVILATSRVPLEGGLEIAVAPLETAAADTRTQLTEAAELFHDRAGMLLPGYAAGAFDAPAVAALCRRLGGLPLAIELIAPWMRTLSASDLLARLDHSLDLLASSDNALAERHRAMRAVLDSTWSWMSADERRVLQRLSVFVGGFSLEAADQVAGATLPLLSTLTELALIRRVPQDDDRTWFVMHELVRQHAGDRLAALPATETDELRRRQIEHLVACGRRFWVERDGPDGHLLLARLLREEANVEAALGWALERGTTEQALLLLAAMKEVWSYAGTLDRPRAGLTAALGRPWDATSPPVAEARAKVAWIGAWPHLYGGSHDEARRLLTESLVLARRVRILDHEALSLRALSRLALEAADPATAERMARGSLDIALRMGDEPAAAWSRIHLAEAAFAAGDHPKTERHLLDCLAAFGRLGIKLGETESLQMLGGLYRGRARWAEALEAYGRCLDVSRASNVLVSARNALLGVAAIAVHFGRHEGAATVFGAADMWDERYGGWESILNPPPDGARAAGRTGLGEAGWTAAHDAGYALSAGEVVSTAAAVIGELHRGVAAPLPAALTTREAEVLGLLAEGLSNEDIASRLVVSPRTVHAHLRSIFRKLDVTSRTAAVHEAGRLGVKL